MIKICQILRIVSTVNNSERSLQKLIIFAKRFQIFIRTSSTEKTILHNILDEKTRWIAESVEAPVVTKRKTRHWRHLKRAPPIRKNNISTEYILLLELRRELLTSLPLML